VVLGEDSVARTDDAATEDEDSVSTDEDDVARIDDNVSTENEEDVVETIALDELEDRTGAGTTTVTGGEFTLMIEYPVVVTVAGEGVSVTTTVWTVSEPWIVFVEMMKSVVGGGLSVSIIVFVAGAGVSVTVSKIVAPCPAEVAAAGPPSTGTTEYVALLTNGSSKISRGKNGNDEPNEMSEDIAKSVGVDVLNRMLVCSEENAGLKA
jgi:hypothetical protein